MNKEIGLGSVELTEIKRVLSSCSDLDAAYLFGSRAKGNFKRGSDVDLALTGDHLSRNELSSLSYVLNQETFLPYHFDLLQLDRADPAVAEHILRVGVKIYP